MKKRVLSMLLAFTLCFSTVPMTAFAQGTEVVAEQEEQQEETEPAAVQEEAEAVATPETPVDESTTAEDSVADEEIEIVSPTEKNVSGGDAGEQDTEANAENDAAVQAVQALIDALPDEVTAENADELQAQLMAIDEAMAALTGEQIAELDMERYDAICAALTGLVAVQDGEHTHFLCGGTTCNGVGGHTEDSATTFSRKLWMNDDTLMIDDTELTAAASADNGYGYLVNNETCYKLPAGNYYLGNSITLDYPIYIVSNNTAELQVPTSNDVKLCLNGYTITANGNFSAIVCSSALSKTTFTLTDCQPVAGTITHTADTTGSGVLLYSQWVASDGDGTRFHMYGGNITDNTAEYGGGVNIEGARGTGGIFNLYGGVISGNKADTYGGGVGTVGQHSAFTMYDGEITNNTAGTDGGGVSAANNDFYMKGGSITGNAAANGAGVSVGCHSSADFYMNGGEIKNNTASDNGGGVYVATSYSDIHLSGTANITGNTTNNNANNVYLSSNKTIIIEGNLTAGAQIGVTTEKMPGKGDFTKVAVGTANHPLTETDRECFTPDAGSDYVIEELEDKFIIKKAGDATWHSHPICGDTCTHKNADGTDQHTPVYWEGVSTLSNNMLPGYYYLIQDVTLKSFWRPAAGVVLDLNGHDITMNADENVIGFYNSGTFTLTDCMGGSGTWGKITHGKKEDGSSYTGGGIALASSYNASDLVMYGGSITGNTYDYPAGVYAPMGDQKKTFTMYGGEITNNTGKGYMYAGGVFIGKNVTFTMIEGTISGNTADSKEGEGGGVYAAYGSTFIMQDGNITGNTAVKMGGGVYAELGSTFTMQGGSITGNTAANGGGVYVEKYYNTKDNFIVSGDVQITENHKTDGTTADNVYLQTETTDGKQAYIKVNGALAETADIGVNVGTIDDSCYKIVAQGLDYTLTEADLGHFSSDENYKTKLLDNSIAFTNGEVHEHAICGKTDCAEHGNALWIPLTYDGDLKYGSNTADKETSGTNIKTYTLPAGNYYLKDNIELYGSIVISGDVNICLNGKTISTTANCDGPFSIDGQYKLTICDCGTSGSIKAKDKNTTYDAVSLSDDSAAFDLYGGMITGGEYGVFGWGSVGLYGGTITGNKTGVGCTSNLSLTIGGDVKITGNDRNVYLEGGSIVPEPFTIDKSLTQDAQIGITTYPAPSEGNTIQIATGATNPDLDYSKIFTPDVTDQNYAVSKDADGNLYLGIHQHSWIYSAKEATITIKCDDASGCNLGTDFAVTYTVTAPAVADLTYSGNAKAATISVSEIPTGVTLPKVPSVTYQKESGNGFENLNGEPTDAGTYKASITMDGETASVTYTIVSKVVTNPTIEIAGTYTYDGTAKEPTVVVKDGDKVIPSTEYSVSYENNTNVGTATIKITDVAGGNYIVNGSTTFTIGKGSYTGKVGKTVNIVKKRSTEQTGTLTAADFFSEGEVPDGAVISDVKGGVDSDVVAEMVLNETTGEFSYTSAVNITSTTDQTCTVTITSTNYNNITATLTFHPTDKVTVTIEGLTYADKTYDGSAIEPTGTLKVSDDKVPVNDLEVLYEGTSANGTKYSNIYAPKDAGTYTVTYKVPDSNENYTGSVEYAFTISPKTVTADMISTIPDETYTGSAIEPRPAVMDSKDTMYFGTDFDFSYENNIDAGENTATVTITGIGNYTGTANRTFTIKPKDISGAKIELKNSSFTYDGIKKTVEITSVTLDGKTLTDNKDYEIKEGNEFISANDSITLAIAGKGNYTGTATTTWEIAKATPVLDNFDVTGLSEAQTYDGNPKAVTAKPKSGVIDMGEVTVYYEGTGATTYTRSTTSPTNAGTYKVILSVAEGANYTKAEIEAGTLTISKAVLNVEDITEFFEYTKTGAQSISLANLVPGAKSYTLKPVTSDSATGVLTGLITVNSKGLLEFTLSALTKANIDNKVTVPVTITSENYKDVTVNVTIYISPEYRIIEGANSSWTQNTTGTIVIRGNGEYSKFHAVKVDGKEIDRSNYEVTEGSTIITLKAEYLKTLSTGSHTFAIVWDNGIASTNFNIAANTPSNNGNSSNNDSSDNSSNDSTNNTDIVATTNDPAQEMDKVPATGDPFGIWLTLFVISLTGFAGMLVRRKKN